MQSACNGKEVLPAVRIFRPDAIILDISIPQAIRQLSTDVRRPLRIAIAEQVGLDHYLEKPADPAKLLALLGTLHPKP